jgi:hypothetical protein
LCQIRGFGLLVVVVDVVSDGLFQFLGGAVNARSKLLFGEGGEPAFDQVEPGRGSRREVEMEARPLGQPVADQFGLVGAVVVQDQVDVEFRGTFFSIVSRKARNSIRSGGGDGSRR